MKIQKGDYVVIEYLNTPEDPQSIYVGETVRVDGINVQAQFPISTTKTAFGYQAYLRSEVRPATDVEILAAKLRGL